MDEHGGDEQALTNGTQRGLRRAGQAGASKVFSSRATCGRMCRGDGKSGLPRDHDRQVVNRLLPVMAALVNRTAGQSVVEAKIRACPVFKKAKTLAQQGILTFGTPQGSKGLVLQRPLSWLTFAACGTER